MNYNEYNEVINGEKTFNQVAKLLLSGRTVGIGWADETYTHLDIVFKLEILKFGGFQRGIKENYLYVSIIDHTSYAFSIEDIKLGDYIQNKLRMNNETGDKIKELINEIIVKINEYYSGLTLNDEVEIIEEPKKIEKITVREKTLGFPNVEVTQYIEHLEQQCKKQKEVIDKIKDLLIIKKARYLNEDDYILNERDLDGILDILNEVSK